MFLGGVANPDMTCRLSEHFYSPLSRSSLLSFIPITSYSIMVKLLRLANSANPAKQLPVRPQIQMILDLTDQLTEQALGYGTWSVNY